jgi:hypothetical protein
VLDCPKNCKMAHTFLWDYSDKKLKLVQHLERGHLRRQRRPFALRRRLKRRERFITRASHSAAQWEVRFMSLSPCPAAAAWPAGKGRGSARPG